tara:strand:- start:50418 stop:51398 length:981 start_codon:yes stop_codon:yes gene_type:complete
MSHEITATDSAVFQGTKAWHGLGYVVEDEMSPLAAVETAGLDWYVHKTDGVFGYTAGGTTVTDSKRCMTYREDTKEVLGYVSGDYNVFQNVELAKLAMSVSESANVESAFSMMGGKRIVLLLKGGSIEVGNQNDVLDDYFCLVNGHDGKFSLRAFGTSVRVVCNNTLQMALDKAKGQTYSISHNGNFQTKLQDMRQALSQYNKSRDWFATTVNELAKKEVSTSMLETFWMESFAMTVGDDVLKDRDRSIKESIKFLENVKVTFEQERDEKNLPASMWLAANAVTNYVQHKTADRGRKASYESRAGDVLMGKRADLSRKVMKHAMTC